MKSRGLILSGVLIAALLASGAVVASGLQDAPPRDARPAQDPTANLNRQTPAPVNVPVGVAPIETAPAGDPAPAAPIAVVPTTDAPIVVAEAPVEETDAEKAEDARPAAKPDETGVPGRRQRRRVAIVQAIDKITAQSMRFEVEVGGRPVRFANSLIFTARACEVSAPDEQTEDAVAYLDVSIQPRGVVQNPGPRQIFRGWMFASSPAVSGLQHPIYDAWVVGCKA